MQPTVEFLVGDSNPSRVKIAAAPVAAVDQPGFEPPTKNSAVGCVTIRPEFNVKVKGLPTAWNLLSENF